MKKFLFILIMGLVMFGFCELAFRIAGFYPASLPDFDKAGVQAYYWVCDRNLGFRNRANGSYDYDLIASDPHSSTDKNGFRNGYGWRDDTTNKIVLFVGDSYVFGAEVDDDQTICSEVTKLIKPSLGLVALNAGVRGFNTVQAKRMMEECLKQYSNIISVVYVYCSNDIYENVYSSTYTPAKVPIAKLNKETGVLSEIDVVDPDVPFGSDFSRLMKQKDEAKVTRLGNKRWDRRLRDKLRVHSAFLNSINMTFTNLKEPKKEMKPKRSNVYGRDVLIALLKEMQKTCHENGVQFMVTGVTTGSSLFGIDKWSNMAGVDFIDVSAGFVKPQFYYMARRRDHLYDLHYNLHGTKTFAKEFAPQFEGGLK